MQLSLQRFGAPAGSLGFDDRFNRERPTSN